MRNAIMTLVVFSFIFLNEDARAQKNGKWISLFDGKTLNGWHSYGKESPGKAWEVEDGAIHLTTSKRKDSYQTREGGDLVTEEAFGDFELKLEWKISKDGNSGIIFYVQDKPEKYEATWHTGPEIQVLDAGGHPDGEIHKHNVGDLYDLVAGASHPAKPDGEWNETTIKSRDGQLDVYLNGVHIVSTTLWDENWKELIANSKFKDMPGFGTFKSGHIALQDHGNEVWYRNIKIRRL